MNTHLDELINRWPEGKLSDEELRRLTEALDTPEGRAALRGDWFLEAALPEALRTTPVLKLAQRMEPMVASQQAESKRWTGWLSWRPLTAAAAGLAFGIFCTSMVFAYALHERRLSLLRESFEGGRFYWQSGFPKQLGQWGGDDAKVVSSKAGVTPKDGTSMLKLEPVHTDLFTRTHCIVDLQKQPQALGSTMRQIELRASFHPSVLGKKDRYVLRAAAFADGPEKVEERWMKDLWVEIDEHALAYAARGVSVPAGTDGWQTITLMIDVPPGSRILVISMWSATMDGKPANRAAHYLDDVRLSGVINEPLP